MEQLMNKFDVNSTKYSTFVAEMIHATTNKFNPAFVVWPASFTEEDKLLALKSFRMFGDKDYQYECKPTSLYATLIKGDCKMKSINEQMNNIDYGDFIGLAYMEAIMIPEVNNGK